MEYNLRTEGLLPGQSSILQKSSCFRSWALLYGCMHLEIQSQHEVKCREGANKVMIVRRSNRFSSYPFSPLALPVVAAFTG